MFDPNVAEQIDTVTFEAMPRALWFRLLQVEICIFDCSKKGHIALDDLRRLQRKVGEAERELDIGSAGLTASSADNVTLGTMIEVIDEEEFTNIMQLVLSSVSS